MSGGTSLYGDLASAVKKIRCGPLRIHTGEMMKRYMIGGASAARLAGAPVELPPDLEAAAKRCNRDDRSWLRYFVKRAREGFAPPWPDAEPSSPERVASVIRSRSRRAFFALVAAGMVAPNAR